jgi:hypothetical protein
MKKQGLGVRDQGPGTVIMKPSEIYVLGLDYRIELSPGAIDRIILETGGKEKETSQIVYHLSKMERWFEA